MQVLLSKELSSSGGYSRKPITVTTSSIVGAEAVKPEVEIDVEATGANLTYRYVLVAYGASITIGDATGITGHTLADEGVDLQILDGATKQFGLTFGVS